MKVYLSGPMSGIPAFNFPEFERVAADLRGRGHEVISPVELDDPVQRQVSVSSPDGNPDTYHSHGMTREQFLARDAAVIVEHSATLDAIVTMPGWEASDGATFEVGVAALRKIPRLDYDPAAPEGVSTSALLSDARYRAAVDGTEGGDVLPGDEPFETYEANPLRQAQVTGGVKDNRGKPRLDLIPTKPLMAMGEVLDFGTRKYKPHNWRLGLKWGDTLASAQRHILAFLDGEDLDPETGKPHLAHALCQVTFATEYYLTGTGIDDRWSSMPESAKAEARA